MGRRLDPINSRAGGRCSTRHKGGARALAVDLDDFDSVSVAGPLSRYHALVNRGRIRPDPAQAQVAERLDGLHSRLGGFQPTPETGGRGSLPKGDRRLAPPRGAYIPRAV